MSKIDDLSFKLGAIENQLRELRARTAEDRTELAQNHKEIQEAFAQLRDATAAAIAELRQSVMREVRDIRPQLATLQMSRPRLVVLASIGIGALWIAMRGIEALFQWGLTRFLNMKLGGS